MEELLIKCKFTRGTHSHERKFWIPAPGSGHFTGLSDISHCYSQKKSPLTAGDLDDKVEEGFVSVALVSRKDKLITVALPDGGVCDIEPGIALKSTVDYVPC